MIEIVEGKPWHCGQMARILRHEHQRELTHAGVNIHREIKSSFDGSFWRRAGLIDGRLVGLGGVMGSGINSIGFVWMALSDEVRKHPIATARILRDLLDEIMETRRELATVVIPEDDAALKLAVFLGFHCEHDGQGAQAYSRIGRRDLAKYLKENQDLRMNSGKGTCVPLGYKRNEL
jgi:hypothetical protein